MSDGQSFIDFYAVLQVDPSCDAKMLETAYRHLAKMYHPDHPQTADPDRFNAVVAAYRVLRTAESRTEYDLQHALHATGGVYATGGNGAAAASPAPGDVHDRAALDDAEAHARILTLLYRKRRENAQSAGIAAYYIQQMLGCSDELFEFHRWYLKSKGWIAIDEGGALAITIDGVDHVISLSRTAAVEKLLIGRPTDLGDGNGAAGDDGAVDDEPRSS